MGICQPVMENCCDSIRRLSGRAGYLEEEGITENLSRRLGKVKKVIFMFFVSVLSGCVQAVNNYPLISKIFHSYTIEKPDGVGDTHPTSMVRLIAEADEHDGKLVSVNGILSCKDKRVELFMSDLSYRLFSTAERMAMPVMPEDVQERCAAHAEGEVVTVFGLYRKPREDVDDYTIGRFEWVNHIGFAGFSYAKKW